MEPVQRSHHRDSTNSCRPRGKASPGLVGDNDQAVGALTDEKKKAYTDWLNQPEAARALLGEIVCWLDA